MILSSFKRFVIKKEITYNNNILFTVEKKLNKVIHIKNMTRRLKEDEKAITLSGSFFRISFFKSYFDTRTRFYHVSLVKIGRK